MARWDRADTGNRIPDWFFEAVERPSSEHRVEVEDCDVAYRRWGEPGRPPLLFIHGMNAHSHWWDFIAPAFADDYSVVAMDLTGMGDSDYRYDYTGEIYAREVVAVCDDAQLDASVAVVAHSFGGLIATRAAVQNPERFGRLVLVDSGVRHPDEADVERPAMGGRAKVYPDRETALARFRLQPPQDCANDYILEYIARHSVMPTDGGWAWKFDEDLLDSLRDAERTPDEYAQLGIPLDVIYGAESRLYSAKSYEYLQTLYRGDITVIPIADAQHHVFLDQPLAFIDALKTLLERA